MVVTILYFDVGHTARHIEAQALVLTKTERFLNGGHCYSNVVEKICCRCMLSSTTN